MEIDRRLFLAGLAGLPLTACSGRFSLNHTNIPRFASAFKYARQEKFGMAVFNAAGDIHFEVDLPTRGHSVVANPKTGTLVSVARRPGTVLVIIDPKTGKDIRTIEAAAGRHYYGHAIFSADGAYLYTTENAYDEGNGVIGIYNAHDFTRIGEFSAYGVGPHELLLMPDGHTLAIAIGGIQTHPSAPRQALNAGNMRPSLCFVDRRNGQLLKRWEIPQRNLRPLSIRHISMNSMGHVAAAFQWEGDTTMIPPLIGICTHKTGWKILRAPLDVQKKMRLYCGSVAFSKKGESFIVSSPRGGIMTKWSWDGSFLGTFELADGCGVAHNGKDGFILTSGLGYMQTLHPLQKFTSTPIQTSHLWDNHLTPL